MLSRQRAICRRISPALLAPTRRWRPVSGFEESACGHRRRSGGGVGRRCRVGGRGRRWAGSRSRLLGLGCDVRGPRRRGGRGRAGSLGGLRGGRLRGGVGDRFGEKVVRGIAGGRGHPEEVVS